MQMIHARRFAGELLYRLARRNQFPVITPGILRLLGWQEAKVLSHESAATKSGELFSASTSTVAAPRQPLKPSTTHISPAPPIRWHLLSKSVVSAYSFGALQSDAAALPQIMMNNTNNHRSDESAIFITSGRVFKRKNPRIVAEIDTAILCGGQGSFNYYHFSLECLPKVWMSSLLPDEFSEALIILPKECESIPQFQDLVNILAPKRRKLYLKSNDFASVKRVLVFDEVNYGPFNLPSGRWPTLADYYAHDACMDLFLRHLRSSVLPDVQRGGRKSRIFLARPSNRRSYNQDEVISLVKRYGFEVVYPESLNIASQAALFNGASVVVGPSGAAWVGLSFCDPGTQAISWLPPEYSGFCSYASLAYKCNADIYYINSKYARSLRSTDDVYKLGYTVDISALGRALELIIEDASV